MPLVPSTFADYLNQNRAGLALSPKDIIAYSIRSGTYLLTGELLRGRGEDDLYQQSDVIEETVILKATLPRNSSSRPGATRTRRTGPSLSPNSTRSAAAPSRSKTTPRH
jgi:hypothetical protein